MEDGFTGRIPSFYVPIVNFTQRMSPDTFYTPHDIAEKMVAATETRAPRIIADFAAGDGGLLKTASSKWPRSRMIATDVSGIAVTRLKRNQPGWEVGRCDFLNTSSRESCRALADLEKRVSLILLNPPFSCPGSTICRLVGKGYDIQCSRGMAFVLNALRYLAPDGELVCVLPAGSLQIQKDARAWAFLHAFFYADIVSRNGHRTFVGCSARTVTVRLRPRDTALQAPSRQSRPKTPETIFASVTIYRGKLPMYMLGQDRGPVLVPLVHSTCLRNSSVDFEQFETAQIGDTINGPVVLLPRVGQPSKEKVVLYRGRRKFVMSDCVLALHSRHNLEVVYSRILKGWPSISRLYMGTGARFLTVSAVAAFLRRRGIQVNAPRGRSYSRQLTQQVNLPPPVLAAEEVQALVSGFCGRNGHR